jgi:hypothetical protein
MSGKTLYFNGINGHTGRYLIPPTLEADLAATLRARAEAALFERLKKLMEHYQPGGVEKKRKTIFDGNPKDLSETGWGVVFASNVSRRVREALGPLLEHRREQATFADKRFFQTFDHQLGESVHSFLRRNDVRPNEMADPENGVPYYLLLVGDPVALPYRFQQELDVNYGVGRIHFPEVDDYRRYADSVIAAERRARLPREVVLFGVRNENDPATQETSDGLVDPLEKTLLGNRTDWILRALKGAEARRDQLARLLGGPETPALLFTAGHGVAFPPEDERQLEAQGGLICQDWPGPQDEVGVRREHYFAADDLPEDAKVQGLVAFFLACHSVGTPERNIYFNESGDTYGAQEQIAPQAFVSRLGQKLLSQGALAVIGHVDRAMTTTFGGSGPNDGVDNYRNCLRRLLEGHTVGWAMEQFNYSHATTSTKLSNLWQDEQFWVDIDGEHLMEAWKANNDAQGFAVFGDPAVKLSARA